MSEWRDVIREHEDELRRIVEDRANGTPPPLDPFGSWARVDPGPALRGEVVTQPPTILRRADGLALIYPAKVNAVVGEPEAGKGWLALGACAEVLTAGDHVLYIDFEDEVTTSVERLRALGLPDATLAERFGYVRPDDPQPRVAGFVDRLLDPMPALVVLDGVTEASRLEGLDINSNVEMAKWRAELASRIARAGAAVLLIDHVGRNRENRGRNAIGAQSKLAGVDAQLMLEVIRPFGRDRDGLVKVTVAKDRGGHLRRHDPPIAVMTLSSDDDGATVTLSLDPPKASTDPEGHHRPTFLMERVSRALEDAGEAGLNARAIRDLRGSNVHLPRAADRLVAEGFARVHHDGKSRTYTTAKPYREAADSDA